MSDYGWIEMMIVVVMIVMLLIKLRILTVMIIMMLMACADTVILSIILSLRTLIW